MNLSIKTLEFDSSLFNYPVGKLTIDENWNEEDFLKEAKEFQLVYIFSEKPIVFMDSQIKWVDTKITFEKKLLYPKEETEIKFFEGEHNQELEDLAYLSGTYSRFQTDSRLQKEEFQNLYKLWIIQALEKKEVLVAPQNTGLVTFSLNKELGRIGLIAVSEKSQSLGLGKKLIQTAEYKAFQQGAKVMQITTQKQNVAACKLFESLEYNLVDQVFVNHWWNSLSFSRQSQ